ncbi:hypothetical protein [Cerasicoccus arenae]|uniref:Uncharacterized protein n=1 Tax=Cerasicoccus arenae TaxID=424488 RepID=A0A8J3GCV4_9BACT|nr:hypothetical protein [Cerasicoccus arenae]MBK1857723.1 hypothetical protein [Cerasicoccus arenae]GHB91171.1 hypothetical protein GCM10007047_02670 [Cerasicoccus arenae]
MKTHNTDDGFALVTAIVLMGFIMLLLVSMSALVQVEIHAVANNRTNTIAQQNAIFALNEALGQLQKVAGPDQRTTATADLLASTQDGSHNWTGVWGNRNPSAAYTSKPQLLNWLVSGNGVVNYTVSTDAESFGQVITADDPTIAPSDSISLGSAEDRGALSNDITINGQPACLLVGPNSVGHLEDYVVAPLLNIEDVQGGGGGAAGRYGWWIEDEGVKARLNLVDPKASSASTNQERFNRLLTAQRHGIEMMTSDGSKLFDVVYNVEGTDSDAVDFREGLNRLTDEGQVPLLAGFETEDMKEALRRRSPDFSIYSKGVLADSLRGGLKRDLTALFYLEPSDWSGQLKVSLDEVSAFDQDGSRHIAAFQDDAIYADSTLTTSSSVSPDSRSPSAATWEQLDSFFDYQSTNSGTVNTQLRNDDEMGLSPILLRWGVSFDVQCAADGTLGKLHLFPHVILWNPYNATLRGSYSIRMEFADEQNNNTTAKYLYFITPRIESDGVTPIGAPPYNVYHQEFIAPEDASSGKYSNRKLEFKIDSIDIPPGQAYVFTPETTRPYSNSGNNLLVNGYDTTSSFTRSINHIFSPDEVEFSAIVLANNQGGAGGTISCHLMDAGGESMQFIDAVGLAAFAEVDDAKNATIVTDVSASGFNAFRNLALGPVNARNQVGLSVMNSLQDTDGRYNWMSNINQRSASIGRSWFEWSQGFSSTPNWSTAKVQAGDSTWTIDLVSNSPARAYNGPSRFPATGVQEAILFNLPRRDTPVIALGQLQHAQMTLTPSGVEPSYPFGNSYADMRIPQDRLLRPNTKANSGNTSGSGTHLTDVSYLLNRRLWDRFFFSGRPDLPTDQLQQWLNLDEPLPFAPLSYLSGASAVDVEDFNRAASSLMLDGAFNVNSTSLEAWAALLGSLRNVEVDPETGSEGPAVSGSPFVRTPYVSGGSSTFSRVSRWGGYRTLSDTEVRQMAARIVEEVKARGPFLSMGDFVNRSLESYPDESGLSGALQAAIDAVSNINQKILEADRPPSNSIPDGDEEIWENSGISYYLQNIKAPRRAFQYTGRAKSAMAPGFLTQADILQVLGPGMAARSDTFVIRAYGETVNPYSSPSSSDYVVGRAWCEAVVQRMPEYVDANGNSPETLPVTGGSVNLTTINQNFGRRFEIVSFRWLQADEI